MNEIHVTRTIYVLYVPEIQNSNVDIKCLGEI